MKKYIRYIVFFILGLVGFYLILVLIPWSEEKMPKDDVFSTKEFLNIAHRGGKGLAPENTMYAFSNALMVGADVLEMDVHLSKDGVLVAIHDKMVDRTTDKIGLVKEFSLKELKEMDAGFRFEQNGKFPFRGQGITIPTLEEVFQAFPDIKMMIEIKPINEQNFESVILLCTLLKKYHRIKYSMIASFASDVINEFQKLCPTGRTVSPLSDSLQFLVLQKLFIAHFYSPRHIAFAVPPTAFNNVVEIYNTLFLRELNERNVMVYLWTINDSKEMKKYIESGSQGVLTDYPDELSRVMKKP